jgi:hypothetical protein
MPSLGRVVVNGRRRNDFEGRLAAVLHVEKVGGDADALR